MAIKINIEDLEKEHGVTFEMNVRSALNGDIMIMEHKDIDIVIKPNDNKIVAFPKDIMSDAVYGAESRMLEFLRKNGVVEFDSIQGGNVYGSLEGKIMESQKIDSIKATLLSLSEWFKTERSYITGATAFDELENDALLNPDNEESTELGQVPAAAKKGSITQDNLFAPYIYGRYTYE